MVVRKRSGIRRRLIVIASMATVVSAGRSPETRNAISARPNTIAGHGVCTKKSFSGVSPQRTTKSPTGLVMWKTNVLWFWM